MIIFNNEREAEVIKDIDKNFLEDLININQVNSLSNKIKSIIKNTKEVKQFMFNISKETSYYFGINNNNIGNVYSPISISEDFSGSLTIIWKDNKISLVDLDYEKIVNFENYLNFFRDISYEEKFVPEILKDQNFRDYKSFDNLLIENIKNNNFELFEKVFEVFNFFKENGVKFSNVDLSYSIYYETFCNSEDLYFGKIYSENGLSYDFDSLLYYSNAKHKKLEKSDLDEFINFFSLFYNKLVPIEYKKINTNNVIFLSPVFYSLLNFYFGYNLDGKNIYYNKSFFNMKDFENNKEISNKKFDLYFDPFLDYELSSYAISTEGLTPQKTTFIKDGKLTQPSITLKSSKMLNMPPNNGFGNGKLILEPFDNNLVEFINEIDDCYIIFDILGLHTQEPISGNFSLSVSTGLLKEKGNFVGLIKGNINGNIFDIFRSGNFKILKNNYNNKYSFYTKLNILN
ncbi:MAG: metallopeptidase TldD-related protein [Spirochaetes bacterium]|nr:metallopeptidase TldD-related protein [Spirochaetota bacterium]